jgi:hypothetical protein
VFTAPRKRCGWRPRWLARVAGLRLSSSVAAGCRRCFSAAQIAATLRRDCGPDIDDDRVLGFLEGRELA